MTTKQIERKKTREHISELHKKYYGKNKVKQEKETAKADKQRIGAHQGKEKKKKPDVASGQKKTSGVEVKDSRPTRAQLMAIAQKQDIKYFRILTKDELITVLALSDEQGKEKEIAKIQEAAKKRWKAGWTNK